MECEHEFEVAKELGRGGFGAVHLGRCLNCGHEVAIKMLTQVDDSDARRRFKREVKQLELLNHPNIMPILFANVECEQPYYVMLLMAGGALTSLAGDLPIEDVLYTGLAVASALEALHDSNALHRDIKPDNILLSAQGSVRVGDFGGGNHPLCTIQYTVNAFGTPGFMAPEILEGATKATDVYSLGTTLHCLITGKRPIGNGQRDTRSTGAGVPEQLRALIWQMTSPIASERPTVRQVVVKLNNVLDGLGAPKVDAPAPKGSFWGPLLATFAGAALGAAALKILFDDNDDGEDD